MQNKIYLLTGNLYEKKVLKLLECLGENKSVISGILVSSTKTSVLRKIRSRLYIVILSLIELLASKVFSLHPIRLVQHSWGQKGMNSWNLLEIKKSDSDLIQGVEIVLDFEVNVSSFKDLGSNSDKIFVVAYSGGFFNDEILSLKNLVLLNAHMGKMPTYRGMAVVEWALLNGETPYATAMQIASVIDGGDVFLEKAINISEVQSHSELRKLGYESCLKIMADLLVQISQNAQTSRKQEGKGKYYYRMHNKLLSTVSEKFQKN